MSHHPSFLGLPAKIRLEIYIFAGLVRVCPINLNLESSRRPYRETCLAKYAKYHRADLCPNSPRPEMCYCEFWRMRYNLLFYPWPADGECVCPALPLQLLTVCRSVHNETFDILYSHNSFRLRLDGQVKLGPPLLGKMTSLHVRLNTCSCTSGHDCENTEESCFDCHRKCKRGTDLPFSDKPNKYLGPNQNSDTVPRWKDLCKVLEHSLRPEMRFSVICDCVDVAAAKQIIGPMDGFPKLTGCAIRLGQSPRTDLRQLAETTVLKLTNPLPPASSTSFRFLDLPIELRRQILWHTDLVAPANLHWCQFYTRFSVLRINQWDERHHRCCMRCTAAAETCCCPANHAAFSSAPCLCWRFPAPLFLASRWLHREATALFFAANTFVLGGESWNGFHNYHSDPDLVHAPLPLNLFQRIHPPALPLLRSLRFHFIGEELLERWRAMAAYIARHLDTANLTIALERTADDALSTFGDGMAHDEIFDAFRDIAAAFRFQVPLRDFFMHIAFSPDDGIADELCEEWEARLEKHVMGEGYDAEARGKHEKRGLSFTEVLGAPELLCGPDGSLE